MGVSPIHHQTPWCRVSLDAFLGISAPLNSWRRSLPSLKKILPPDTSLFKSQCLDTSSHGQVPTPRGGGCGPGVSDGNMKNTDSNSPFNGKQVRTAAAGPETATRLRRHRRSCEAPLRRGARAARGKAASTSSPWVRLENAAKVIAYAPPNVSVHPGDRITIRHREKMVPPISHIRYKVGSNVTENRAGRIPQPGPRGAGRRGPAQADGFRAI